MKSDKLYTIVSIVIFIVIFGLGVFCGYSFKKEKKVPVIRPVEKNIIDTLTVTNTEIKYRIKYLDSVKYDTIAKIYALDDSSSVKLFIELCSK